MGKNSLVDVYKIGTQVKLEDDVFGKIVAICIRGNNNVTYECGWWNGRSYDTRWFEGNEFEVSVDDNTRIGFY